MFFIFELSSYFENIIEFGNEIKLENVIQFLNVILFQNVIDLKFVKYLIIFLYISTLDSKCEI